MYRMQNRDGKRMRTRSLLVTTCFCFAGLLASRGNACSVPVFRYALEQWTPDSYRLVILHDEDLADETNTRIEKSVELLKDSHANLQIVTMDLREEIDPRDKWLLDIPEIDQYPAFALINPGGGIYSPQLVTLGTLPELPLKKLISSKKRNELINQLVGGTSAVWILLECGIPEKDNASYELLKTELARHQSELKLPEIDPDDLKDLSVRPEDVRIQFQILRLSRDDEEEQALVNLLLASEPDLRDVPFLTEPMAFPVFGRGRVLYSLIGPGIQSNTIEEACRFLVGACQCTVKAENPGVDLLMDYDWSETIQPSAPEGVEIALTGLAGFQEDEFSSKQDFNSESVVDLSFPDQDDSNLKEEHWENSPNETMGSTSASSRDQSAGNLFGVWTLLGMIGCVVFVASLGVMFRS